VGEVKVLIYMKNSQEYIVEKDIPVSNSVNGEGSELRKEEATVYTTDESGNEVPFIAQTRRPEIGGVVISAKGAANEAVRLQIVRLVMALYGVEANKVEVLQMG
jgi:stage III sporulation protein AG